MEAVQNDSKTQAGRETLTGLTWTLGLIAGLLSGVVHVAVQDPAVTALAVTAACMALGFARPQRPWRWIVAVALPIPLVLVAAKLGGYYANFTRATLAGSILVILPGVAGGFGGSFFRRFISHVFLAEK